MANWYINADSVGNGTDPASAHSSILSVVWTSGDFVWIRRTHVECLNNGVHGFAPWSAAGDARFAFAVGWPSSGYPFFDQRPAAGISAGWDADNPVNAVNSQYGLPFPMFVASNASASSGTIIGRGMTLANLCWNQLGASQQMPFRRLVNPSHFNNVALLREDGRWVGALGTSNQFPNEADKIYVAASCGGGFFGTTDGPYIFNHFVVLTGSIVTGAIFRDTGPSYIGVFENQCTSLDHIVEDQGLASVGQPNGYLVERAIGIEPNGGAFGTGLTGNTNPALLSCNDYFGRGAIHHNAGGKPNYRTANSAEAMHDDNRSVYVNIASASAANQSLTGEAQKFNVARRMFNVVSGTALTVRLPVYVGSSSVMSLAWGIRAGLMARGGFYKAPKQVLPGTPAEWGGTFVSGGSAWLLEYQFHPTETAFVPFDVGVPQWTSASSGVGFSDYLLISEPYSV